MTTWDAAGGWPTLARAVKADAKVFQFVCDDVEAPSGETLKRSYVRHPGAVGVIALDDEDRVVVVRQYRHPVGMTLVEPPAGLLDKPGEDPLVAAKRELAEEALLAADDWRVLVDFLCSPGSTQEGIRVFLARGLRAAPRPDGFLVEGEEAHMSVDRVPFADLVAAVLAGEVHNPGLVVGILGLAAARAGDGVGALRPAQAPWPTRAAKEAVDGALG